MPYLLVAERGLLVVTFEGARAGREQREMLRVRRVLVRQNVGLHLRLRIQKHIQKRCGAAALAGRSGGGGGSEPGRAGHVLVAYPEWAAHAGQRTPDLPVVDDGFHLLERYGADMVVKCRAHSIT